MAIDLKTNVIATATVPIEIGTGSVGIKIVQESEISSAAARKAAVNRAIGRLVDTVPAGKAMAAVRLTRAAGLGVVRRTERRPVVLPLVAILQLRVRERHHQPVAVRIQAVQDQRAEARQARPNPT
jgi:hypothetical protein